MSKYYRYYLLIVLTAILALNFVDRVALAAGFLGFDQAQDAVADQQRLGRDDDVDAIWLDAHAILDLHDRHRRLPAEEIGQHALAGRIKVLDDDETHTAVRRHRIQKCGGDFEPARRHPDADDREGPANPFRRVAAPRVGRGLPLGRGRAAGDRSSPAWGGFTGISLTFGQLLTPK